MNEMLLLALALAVAFFMVTLAQAGASSNLRAASRTTLVVLLGWFLAVLRFGLQPWLKLTALTQAMLVLSVLAVLLAWRLYFHERRASVMAPISTVDRLNVIFAGLFALLLFLQQGTPQSMLVGMFLVCGALFLAFGARQQ